MSTLRNQLSMLLTLARDIQREPDYHAAAKADDAARAAGIGDKRMRPPIDIAIGKVIEFAQEQLQNMDEEEIAALADEWTDMLNRERWEPTTLDDPGDRPPAA